MKPPNFFFFWGGGFFNSAQLLVEIYGDVEWWIEIVQHRMLRILLWEISMFCWDFPIDTESVIEDADSSIGLWMIEVITLILEDGCFWEDCKTMGKALWNEELNMVIFCQLYCHMLAIGWRAFTNIYCDIIIVFFRLPCPPLAKRGSLTHSQALALSKRTRDVTAAL